MNDDLVWKALADPTRRTMLDYLRETRRTTGELAELLPHLSRYGVMKHLTVLTEAELVIVRREGKYRWNALNAVPIQKIYERWVKPYEQHWSAQLTGLQAFAEQAARQDKHNGDETDE